MFDIANQVPMPLDLYGWILVGVALLLVMMFVASGPDDKD